MRTAILNRLVKTDLIERVASKQWFEGGAVVTTLMVSYATYKKIINRTPPPPQIYISSTNAAAHIHLTKQ